MPRHGPIGGAPRLLRRSLLRRAGCAAPGAHAQCGRVHVPLLSRPPRPALPRPPPCRSHPPHHHHGGVGGKAQARDGHGGGGGGAAGEGGGAQRQGGGRGGGGACDEGGLLLLLLADRTRGANRPGCTGVCCRRSRLGLVPLIMPGAVGWRHGSDKTGWRACLLLHPFDQPIPYPPPHTHPHTTPPTHTHPHLCRPSLLRRCASGRTDWRACARCSSTTNPRPSA